MDHKILVYELQPLYEHRIWERPDRELRWLLVTAQVINEKTLQIYEQKIFLCYLVRASDDELKTALLRGMERVAKIVCRRFETCEPDWVAPADIVSLGQIHTEMRRLAERTAAGSEPR